MDSTEFERYLIKDYGSKWSVYLHGQQNYLGRLYIWSKRPGLIDLMDIDLEERFLLFTIGRQVRQALDMAFQPDIFNWASLGNEAQQCHMHLIPRYKAPRAFSGITFLDERWGKNYAPYNKNPQVTEEVLQQVRVRVQECLEEVRSGRS